MTKANNEIGTWKVTWKWKDVEDGAQPWEYEEGGYTIEGVTRGEAAKRIPNGAVLVDVVEA